MAILLMWAFVAQ